MLGLAVATAVLAGVLAGVTIATDRSTALAIERIPASERSVRAVWFVIPGDPNERLAALDRDVDDAFAGIEARGTDAADPVPRGHGSRGVRRHHGDRGVPKHVILRSGRMPRRTCTAARCEVLRLRGLSPAERPGLRLVQVGTATLRSRQLYGDFLLSNDAAVPDATVPPELGETSEYHRPPPPPPLVVAEGREALVSSPALARTYRTYSWVWPVGPTAPRLWDIDELVADTERARVELTERSTSFAVEAPVEELREAERSASVAGTRLLLVGGGVLRCCPFTILAARGMRRDFRGDPPAPEGGSAQRWQLAVLGGLRVERGRTRR